MNAFRPTIVRGGSRPGFALLATITLLALLVLVLVSLASLTRVETQVARNSQQLAHARQHALLGLNVALGRLQELAGPDQRVTATADIVAGSDESKRHWVGVWDGAFNIDPNSTSFQTPRGWLVSGAAPDGAAGVTGPLAAGAGNQIEELVGAGSVDTSVPGAAVSAETEPIKVVSVPGLADNPAGHEVGRFAWWVGDEGVKARVNLVDPWAESTDVDIRRRSLIIAQRSGVERVSSGIGDSLADIFPVNESGLERVVSLEQLPFAHADDGAREVLHATARHRFHDLSAASFSVLADPARGGLKRDLTMWLRHPGAVGAPTNGDFIHTPAAGNDPFGLPRWGLIRSYDAIRSGTGAISPQSFANETTETRQGIHPVVTYFRFGINVSCAGPGSPLVIHLFPQLVLWNPYGVDIAAADYELGFNMPDNAAKMIWRVGDVNGRELGILNFQRTSLNGTGAARHWRFAVSTPVIPAGKSLVFSLAETDPYEAGRNTLVHAVDTGESVTFTATEAPLTTEELESAVFWDRDGWAGGTLFMHLREAPADPSVDTTGTTLPTGTLHAVQLIGYGSPGTNTTQPVPNPDSPEGHHYIPEPVVPLRQITTYASMASGSDDRPRWIAQQNLRAPLVLRPRVHGNINSAYFGAWSGSTLPVFDGEFASAGVTVTGATANDLVLGEFQPDGTPLFSLAQLQHANLSPLHLYPAYAVGNSLADPSIPIGATTESPDAGAGPVGGVSGQIRTLYDVSYLLNRELWDRYYFSTVPQAFSAGDLANSNYRLPNARHVLSRVRALPPLGEINGSDAFLRSASHLFVAGGFNVNSTSYEAWRALLSAHNKLEEDGANAHLFGRYSATSGSPNQVWSGNRILSDAQVDRLARNIVEEVRRRGPFLSLADFVNRRLSTDAAEVDGYKGALQAAIDASDTETIAAVAGEPALAPINNAAEFATNLVHNSTSRYDQRRFQGGVARQAPYSSRLAFAPGYLTQADLLTAIGPVLTARSDTFRIRVYGEVLNPLSGEREGRAWCEAIVQRSTRYVDDALDPWATPAAGSEAERFGRRFEVVSFRWLTASDI